MNEYEEAIETITNEILLCYGEETVGEYESDADNLYNAFDTLKKLASKEKHKKPIDIEFGPCGEKIKERLNKPYKKPTYKLSQFEYDLLSVHKDYKTYNNIANQTHLFKMYEKGYFKDIDTNIPIREILDNCEVI